MPPWPWVILGRVPRLFAGDAEADAEEEQAADLSVPVALPPQVTVVAAAPSAHPEPDHPDMYPYILAVDTGCVLFHFSAQPFHGVCFGEPPYDESNLLVVVRRFQTAGVQQPGDAITATAERIPRRAGHLPVIFNIESIGLTNGGTDYFIAELMVDKGSEHARLLCFDGGLAEWSERSLANPLAAADREWIPSGVLAHEDKLWWFDLSWGILNFDPFAGADDLTLLFHGLADVRALAMTQPDIHHHRCIAESNYEIRFVEIVIPEGDGGGHDQGEAATVTMWTRISAPGGYETIGWHMEYEMTFAEIWDNDSYKKTMLPRKVPVLAVVSPWSPDLVYFALEEERRLFGVNVPEHTVVQVLEEDYELVTPWPAPPSCRFVLPWVLPYSVAEALGMDPFDNRGEIDEDDLHQAAETDDDELHAEEIDSDDEQQSEIDDDDELSAPEIDDDDELSAPEIDSDDELQAGETEDDEVAKSGVTDSGDDDAGEGAI